MKARPRQGWQVQHVLFNTFSLWCQLPGSALHYTALAMHANSLATLCLHACSQAACL